MIAARTILVRAAAHADGYDLRGPEELDAARVGEALGVLSVVLTSHTMDARGIIVSKTYRARPTAVGLAVLADPEAPPPAGLDARPLRALRAVVDGQASSYRGGCADDGEPETDRGDLAPESPPCAGVWCTCFSGGDCGPLPAPERIRARLDATTARDPMIARELLAAAAGLPTPALPALVMLRRLVAMVAAGLSGWRLVSAPADRFAVIPLARAGLAVFSPGDAWARATERGAAFVASLDALTEGHEPPARTPAAPSTRVPLDAEALDALSDDDAARLLDGDATVAEALHLARRYVLEIAPRGPFARITVTARAPDRVCAEAVRVDGPAVHYVEIHTASNDRSALAGLALRLLRRRAT